MAQVVRQEADKYDNTAATLKLATTSMVLDQIAACLEKPREYQSWLQSLPPDQLLTPGQTEINGSGYWEDRFHHPVTPWVQAVIGRGIWCEDDHYRLLGSTVVREQPEWLIRFLAVCSKEAKKLECPTPARVLPVLEHVLAEIGHAP